MCSVVPKILRVAPVNLANDRPRRPRLVSWRRRAQNFDDLFVPLVSVGDVDLDVIRAIFNDGSMARIKLDVLGLPFREGLIVVVHLLEANHVRSEILEDRGPVAEDGVCSEESFVEWKVDSNGVSGVTGCEEDVNRSEIGVCGVALVDGHRQLEVV